MTFTNNERVVLEAMYNSMKANGFDFGFVEDIAPGCGMMKSATARGTLRVIRKKLNITFDSESVNGYHQFYVKGGSTGEHEIPYGTTFDDWITMVSK